MIRATRQAIDGSLAVAGGRSGVQADGDRGRESMVPLYGVVQPCEGGHKLINDSL